MHILIPSFDDSFRGLNIIFELLDRSIRREISLRSSLTFLLTQTVSMFGPIIGLYGPLLCLNIVLGLRNYHRSIHREILPKNCGLNFSLTRIPKFRLVALLACAILGPKPYVDKLSKLNTVIPCFFKIWTKETSGSDSEQWAHWLWRSNRSVSISLDSGEHINSQIHVFQWSRFSKEGISVFSSVN